MKNNDIKIAIKENGVIVIVRGVRGDNLIKLFDALLKGGITMAEITFGKFSDEETCSDLKEIVEKFGSRMLVGAGTVTTYERAQYAVKAGVKYIVSPVSDKKVIERAKEKGLGVISGAFTPTEIKNAYDLGADVVKLFPANALGPKYIKSIRQPLSDIPLICFGGININNVCDYLDAGACAVGVGADIVNMEMIEKGDFEGISLKAENFVNKVKKVINGVNIR